jgi:hypothetical protein
MNPEILFFKIFFALFIILECQNTLKSKYIVNIKRKKEKTVLTSIKLPIEH